MTRFDLITKEVADALSRRRGQIEADQGLAVIQIRILLDDTGPYRAIINCESKDDLGTFHQKRKAVYSSP